MDEDTEVGCQLASAGLSLSELQSVPCSDSNNYDSEAVPDFHVRKRPHLNKY